MVCVQEYSRGCITLVGDAAHVGPVGGQGLNLTMEDAAVLGFHLREGGLNPRAESLRRSGILFAGTNYNVGTAEE